MIINIESNLSFNSRITRIDCKIYLKKSRIIKKSFDIFINNSERIFIKLVKIGHL